MSILDTKHLRTLSGHLRTFSGGGGGNDGVVALASNGCVDSDVQLADLTASVLVKHDETHGADVDDVGVGSSNYEAL